VIVLDENLMGLRLDRPIARRYPGKVLYLPELRPGTTIQDEEIRYYRAEGPTVPRLL